MGSLDKIAAVHLLNVIRPVTTCEGHDYEAVSTNVFCS